MEYIIGKNNMDNELKQEIQRIREHYINVKKNGFQIDLRDVEVIAEHFANWQKEQMLKNIIKTEVTIPASATFKQIRYKLPKDTKYNVGDKVNIIIMDNEKI